VIVKAYQMEVSVAEKVLLQVVDNVVEDFGRRNVFVANAGTAISKHILEQTREDQGIIDGR
jgi:NAD(P)-dependent dehydrogenase (short-subunit alcohol dehydrogenase family)